MIHTLATIFKLAMIELGQLCILVLVYVEKNPL